VGADGVVCGVVLVRATGVYVLERGWARVLKARKGVILAAGQRSSLLLELSGIGNKDVIKVLTHSTPLRHTAAVANERQGGCTVYHEVPLGSRCHLPKEMMRLLLLYADGCICVCVFNQPLLETIGMPMWVDLPGVGESLGNNAILFAQFEREYDPSTIISFSGFSPGFVPKLR
jgi:hypothetical protein